MPTKPNVAHYTNMDSYILDVLYDLHSMRDDPKHAHIAVNATLLICNMALDNTVATPLLCEVLAQIRERLLNFEIETD
jgi:hypothetical protein